MMKPKRWLRWDFIKESFINLFWNFHYITLFGLLTIALSLGLITIGPALMALCSSTRLLADDLKVDLGYYFKEFKRLFIPGLVLSAIIIIGTISLWSSLRILSSSMLSGYRVAAYVAIAAVVMLFFFIIYYPFAAFNERCISKIMLKSIYYASIHLWDTIVQISVLYLLWRLLSISMAVAAILFLPIATYVINRFILANNRDLEER